MLNKCAHLPAYLDRNLARPSVRETKPQNLPGTARR
jgi:hypothetical protein